MIYPDALLAIRSSRLHICPQDVTDVDRKARAAKKAAAKRAASSGWYRNLHGSMSFTGLAGLNVAVEGQKDGDRSACGCWGGAH